MLKELNNNQVFFETIKCENMSVFNLSYHNDRLNKTRKEIFGLDERIDLQKLITPNSSELLKCKVIYSKDIINIEYTPYTKKEVHSFKLIENNSIKYQYKSLNRSEIDSLYSKKELNDDIIIVQNGFVTDTSIANIAVKIDNQWYTPKSPLLQGTTRQRYIDNGVLIPYDISTKMLVDAKSIALLNAMIDFDILNKWEFQ